jgi:hypothetical protein
MNRLWTVLAVLCCALAIPPAHAAKGKVALIPAYVVNGAAGNRAVVTDALRANLEQEGYEVLSAGVVASAMRAEKMDLANPQTVGNLSALREATGADYVVYPRVLSVGVGVNSRNRQANILVNVTGKSKTSFLYTKQIGQVFAPGDAGPAEAVISQDAADTAATRLLGGFYSKVR